MKSSIEMRSSAALGGRGRGGARPPGSAQRGGGRAVRCGAGALVDRGVSVTLDSVGDGVAGTRRAVGFQAGPQAGALTSVRVAVGPPRGVAIEAQVCTGARRRPIRRRISAHDVGITGGSSTAAMRTRLGRVEQHLRQTVGVAGVASRAPTAAIRR